MSSQDNKNLQETFDETNGEQRRALGLTVSVEDMSTSESSLSRCKISTKGIVPPFFGQDLLVNQQTLKLDTSSSRTKGLKKIGIY